MGIWKSIFLLGQRRYAIEIYGIPVVLHLSAFQRLTFSACIAFYTAQNFFLTWRLRIKQMFTKI